jgi:hypothetical protein
VDKNILQGISFLAIMSAHILTGGRIKFLCLVDDVRTALTPATARTNTQKVYFEKKTENELFAISVRFN